MTRILVTLAFASLVLGAASAQVAKPGDYLVASYLSPADAVYAITPNTNVYSTVGTVPTPSAIRGVLVAADNTNYYVASGTNVFQMTPTGVVTTVLPALPASAVWNDLDEDGQLLIGTTLTGGLIRMDPVAATLKTLIGGIHPNAFCLDRDSGDIVVGVWNLNNVMRVKRDGTVTTVIAAFASPYAAGFQSETGDVLLSNRTMIMRLDALNTLTTFATGTGLVKSLVVLGDGNVAAGPHGTIIDLYDRNGTKIGTPYNGPYITKLCMVAEDEHNVWGIHAPTPGALFNISIRFASHPGKPYVSAAALSPRPGIPIDTRTVQLTPDNLFAASLVLPQVFGNFTGILDTSGRAGAYIALPKVAALRGLRFFLATVVLDPQAPSGIAQISQEYGVTIQ